MIGTATLRRSSGTGLAAIALLGGWGMTPVSAEPIFLSKQYPRCTACHYSPSGGGLLTPYGRSLSREEISTFGRRGAASAASPGATRSEESFLYGALGSDSPLQLGLDLRPSHVSVTVPGIAIDDRNFLMNLDLQAAWQRDRWTAYGSVGRKPVRDGEFVSYEHWVAYQVSDALSVRGGRFLPAYGVRFADHTSFAREGVDLAQDDQVYGVEVGVSLDRSLLQLSVGPGRADSLIAGNGRAAFTVSGRYQFDLTPRTVVAGSLLYRGETEFGPRSTHTGVSFGYAPVRWLVTWTHADRRLRRLARSDRAYIIANQTSVEVLRGVWLRVSPQVRWTDKDPWG
ncbi:MAG: hypothetical protein OXH11_21400, partial [Candidatus Aminicenantes bacterium]|nr:hypothetical protein [Candidatus Aminicenantes bacterium]